MPKQRTNNLIKRQINIPYRSIDKYAITNASYLMQDCFMDESGAIRGRFGSEEYFDLSTISSAYASKTPYHYWFQELQEFIVVINGDIYSFTTIGGTYSKIGTGLLATTTKVTFTKVADNDNSAKATLFMANGGKVVYYDGTTCDYIDNNGNYAGTAPSAVTHVASSDQYLFANDNNAKALAKYSAVSKPFDWNVGLGAGYDIPAQAVTDDIIGLYSNNNLIWIQGKDSIEPIQNTGRSVPFIRVHRGLVETGTVNPYAIGIINKIAFFMNSQREICYLDGFNPIIISQPYAERIQSFSSTLDVEVDVQQGIGGRTFIIFNFKDASVSLVFDYTYWVNSNGKQAWYEWGKWNEGNQNYDPYPYRGFSYCTSWNYHIAGGFNDGKLYRMRPDKYTDSGTNIRSELITGIYGHPIEQHKAGDLVFHLRRGDGKQTATSTATYAYVQYRKDMTEQWSTQIPLDLGSIGQTGLLSSKISIGAYHTIQYRFLHTDNAPFVLHGIYEEVKDVGT